MKRAFLVCVAVVWVGILVLGPFVGAHKVGLGELAAGDAVASRIVWQLRVPRLLLALLAGGALAVCGAAFQTLFGNPLAEPYTLGVAGGAALGAAESRISHERGTRSTAVRHILEHGLCA